MGSFRNIPIKQKLMLVIMMTSTGALFLAAIAMGSFELVRFRRSLVRDFSSIAKMVAADNAATLALHDAAGTSAILSAFKSRPEIVFTAIYTTEGNLFAQYPDAPTNLAKNTQTKGHRFEGDRILVFQPIVFRGDKIGTLVLGAGMREPRGRLRSYISIMVVVLLASLLVSVLLSMRLQRLISDPILALCQVARAVTAQNDYSLRATKQSHDELGGLIDGFNQMLDHIQKRDQELRTSEERFRQVTDSIREVFWMSDLTKKEMIYVSPGYEHIWGRTCASLYESPRSWLESVHPEDRERVWQAALTKQAGGKYDEEYRIVQPSGAVRWIHDRAFPVRSETGETYRMAGIAEDITDRKQLEKGILEISEREQGRIGQDLHDGLCQHLISIAFDTDRLQKKLAMRSFSEAAEAKKIFDLVDEAITQARHLARGLYPINLGAEGLAAALQELASKINDRFQIECVWDYPGPVQVEDNAVAIHLYRIAQEAVNNAIRHSGAKRVVIRVTAEADKIHLVIADNGIGIREINNGDGGMGLHIMNYRSRLIGGLLQIQTRPEQGTIISCSVPPKLVNILSSHGKNSSRSQNPTDSDLSGG